MQTQFPQQLLATHDGREADRILRACVHCGFCTATCPTYQLDGNELDSPRGRIYLIKSFLEGEPASPITRQHLDRCLSCQACETTCPSSVDYHHLLDIGRRHLSRSLPRPWHQRLLRRLMARVLVSRRLFGLLAGLGRAGRVLLPKSLARQLQPRPAGGRPAPSHSRRMLLLEGCVQSSLSPATSAAAARVLDRLGISVISAPEEGCCGALAYHLDEQDSGLRQARRQVDLFHDFLESGGEAIISTASGCGNFIKDYARLLADDPHYAPKAETVLSKVKDLSQVLLSENLEALLPGSSAGVGQATRLAFHCPCSLQHGQQLPDVVESLLQRLGFALTPVADSHLCCGSAGTYSLLQPERARQLRDAKLKALEAGEPEAIATANIGCQQHLASASERPVRHWVEYVDARLEH